MSEYDRRGFDCIPANKRLDAFMATGDLAAELMKARPARAYADGPGYVECRYVGESVYLIPVSRDVDIQSARDELIRSTAFGN